MKVKLDPGALIPRRAHDADAGYDLYARESKLVRAGQSAVFDTGVHVALPKGYAGLLVSKSGLNVNHDMTSTGLIDAGYTGSIKVKLFNHGACDYAVKAGDKISQLVVMPVMTSDVDLVDALDETERGENGFGSSGR